MPNYLKNKLSPLNGIGGVLCCFFILLISCAHARDTIKVFPPTDQQPPVPGETNSFGNEEGKSGGAEGMGSIGSGGENSGGGSAPPRPETPIQEILINEIATKIVQLQSSIKEHRTKTEKRKSLGLGFGGADSKHLKNIDDALQDIATDIEELMGKAVSQKDFGNLQTNLLNGVSEEFSILIAERKKTSNKIAGIIKKEIEKGNKGLGDLLKKHDPLENQLIEINNKLGTIITLIENKFPRKREKASIFDGGKLGFLALIVALSAYIGSVRLAILNWLKRPKNDEQKKVLQGILFRMVFADAPLIFAGLSLTIDMVIEIIFGEEPLFFHLAIWLFLVATLVLARQHMVAWKPALKKVWPQLKDKINKPKSPYDYC